MRDRWCLMLALLCGLGAARPAAAAAPPLAIYAAGSLTAAVGALVQAFGAAAGAVAPPVFGPSGLLRARIEHGAAADLLLSADMAQPRRLARERHTLPALLFTRNRLCAIGRVDLGMTQANLLDRLLDPHVRLATSTPGADPAGDYAWQVFARAEALHPGAQAALEGKAMQLVGGPHTPPMVPGKSAVSGIFLKHRADVMLGYCSGAKAVMADVPGLAAVPVPGTLTVGAEYGMAVLTDRRIAERFALFVMSERGQGILARNGFDAVALPAH